MALQIWAFPVFPSSSYSRQSRQDLHSCGLQCWSFLWIFFPRFSSDVQHIDILSCFDLLASLPTSHQPRRDRYVASLFWTYVMNTPQRCSSILWLSDDRKWRKMNYHYLYCLFWCVCKRENNPKGDTLLPPFPGTLVPFIAFQDWPTSDGWWTNLEDISGLRCRCSSSPSVRLDANVTGLSACINFFFTLSFLHILTDHKPPAGSGVQWRCIYMMTAD